MAPASMTAIALRDGRNALQTSGADVPPILHTLEMNLADGGISALDGCSEVLGGSGNSQDPASAGHQLMILHPRAGVKHLYAADSFGIPPSGDYLSRFRLVGISP